jgi:PAS domain S-box-containing protein
MNNATSTKKQLDFERLIADLASRLVFIVPEQLEEAIDSTLRSLGRFLRTERAFLAQFTEDGKSLIFTNIWAAEGISLASNVFEMNLAAEIPWIAQQIRNGQVINAGPGLSDLSDEAEKLRKYLERDGIKSGLVVPVRVEGRSIGLLGLDTIVKPREYPQSIVDRLKIVADMIGTTLHRIRVQEKMEHYRHIVESTTSPVGLVDRDYVYQYINDAYCAAFRKKRHEITGGTVADLFGPEMFDNILKPHYDLSFTGNNVDFQQWFDFPGWGRRFMDVRYYPFFESNHRVSAVVVSAHDITDAKRIELKLKESEERFQAFMNNLPAHAYIKDSSYRHIYANKATLDYMGKDLDEFIGSTNKDLWPAKIAEKLTRLDQKMLSENEPRIVEEWSHSKKGETHWIRDIKFPIDISQDENLIGGIAIDITDHKRREEKLHKALTEIKELKDRLQEENIYLREEIELRHEHKEIIGKSAPVIKMLNRSERVAETDSTVLILGETGTGKELLARTIHQNSARKNRQMVKVNCAALPATLIESELFGREKGAYTGAMSRQIGRFEIADGSTIFLDEIGELPRELQAKLLRVLQEGQFERLGNPKTISVDVRIIASTNRDLARSVAEKRFREDLYYRLNVFSITVPPLRDRTDDIPMLVWTFVKEFEKSMGKTIDNISQKSMAALQRYSWPGNVRQLRNVVEQAMIISQRSTLSIQLPGESGHYGDNLLKDVERNHILRILRQTAWRIRGTGGAAELLGLKPTTLEARMKKLEIKRPK